MEHCSSVLLPTLTVLNHCLYTPSNIWNISLKKGTTERRFLFLKRQLQRTTTSYTAPSSPPLTPRQSTLFISPSEKKKERKKVERKVQLRRSFRGDQFPCPPETGNEPRFIRRSDRHVPWRTSLHTNNGKHASR